MISKRSKTRRLRAARPQLPKSVPLSVGLDITFPMLSSWPKLWCLSICILVCGCAPNSPRQAPKANKLSHGSIAAVSSQYITSGDLVPFEQFQLTGVFGRFDVAVRSDAMAFITNRVPSRDLNVDACSVPAPVFERGGIYKKLDQATVELLDVGDLTVAFGSRNLPISTRTFPDLLKVIVGVVYSADGNQGVFYNPNTTYTLKASGGSGVGPFEVALEAPMELEGIRVNRIAPSAQVPLLQRKRPAVLQWDGLELGDEIVMDLQWTSMGSPWSMSCRLRDDGYFVVSPVLTRMLPDHLAAADEELTFSRVRQVSYRAEGLNSGTFSFVTRVQFPVSF